MILLFVALAQAEGLGSQGYVLPEPPALAAIDRTATRFDEPSSPTDFAVAAASFFAADGSPKAGGVAEISGRAMGLTRNVTAQRYAESAPMRFLGRAALSAATAQDEGDIRAALGLRMVFFDGADPLLEAAYAAAAKAALARCEALRAAQTADALDKYATCVEKAYAISAADLGKSRWNAPGLSLSAAYALRFPDGELSTGGREAASTWVSFAGPLGEDGQGGVAIAWSQGLAEETPNEVGLTVLGRMGIQRARIRAEPGIIVALAEDGPALRVPVVFGGELGLGEDTWIHTRFGLVIDPDADEVSLLSSATFRWGQASEPSFKAE